jgi:MFS family permease
MGRSKLPFVTVAAALFVLLLDGNLPTPLYAVYRERFGFSGAELTLIFAIYAMVLIPSLLVLGQLSDRIGRRRVLAGGLAGAVVGLALLAAARSTLWLFVARTVQGISLGAVVGTAAAALVEAEPHGDHRRAALAAFITCLYVAVATTSVSVGVLSDAASLAVAVRAAGIAVATAATLTAAWHLASD